MRFENGLQVCWAVRDVNMAASSSTRQRFSYPAPFVGGHTFQAYRVRSETPAIINAAAAFGFGLIEQDLNWVVVTRTLVAGETAVPVMFFAIGRWK